MSKQLAPQTFVQRQTKHQVLGGMCHGQTDRWTGRQMSSDPYMYPSLLVTQKAFQQIFTNLAKQCL